MRTLALLCVLFTASPAVAQTIVSGGGGALQTAIDAAAVGDVLLVRAANYSPITVRRGVSILCDGGVSIGSLVTPFQAVSVSGLPVGETFVMRGGQLISYSPFDVLSVGACNGLVAFESITTDLKCRISNNGQVNFIGCKLGRLFAVDSIVSLVDTRCVPGTFVFCGLTATSCRLTISGGEFIGLAGIPFSPGTPGLALIDTAAVVAGDATLRIVAGAASNGGAIDVVGGDLIYDPAIQLVPDGAQPPITGAGTVRTRVSTALRADPLRSLAPFNCSVRGEVGQPVLLLASPPLSPPIVSPFGDLWLQPAVLQLIAGVVPAGGWLSRSYTNGMLPLGRVLMLQGVTIGASGELSIGPALGRVVH